MKSTSLGGDSLTKLIIKYAVPAIISMWIYSLYFIMDGMFIGKFLGANDLAAVNIVMPYINASFALGVMVAVGGGTAIAIKLGENNRKEANRVYSLSIQTFVVLGSILGFCGIFFSRQMATLLGANSVIIDSAERYLFIISFFTLFYLLAYGFAIFVRIDGSPTYSMLCDFAGAAINIVLDYIFIVKFGWGITGAAIATGMAQFGTAFALWFYLKFKPKRLKFKLTKFVLKDMNTICFNGSSEFLTEIATGIVIMAFNINIMRLIGERGVSAFGIIGYISTLVTNTMIGFSQGLQPIVSYSYGAEKYNSIKRTLKIGLVTVIIMGVLFYLGINFFADDIISIFVKSDKKLLDFTRDAIRIYSVPYIIMGLNIIISSYFTAIEDALISVILSVLRGVVIINTLLYIFPMVFSSKGIWLSAPVNEILTLIVSLGVFLTIGRERITAEKVH